MNYQLVSCLYDLYGDEEKIGFYVEKFRILSDLRIPIILFVDKTYDELIHGPFIRKIRLDLNEFWSYRVVMNCWKLPKIRCNKKDTLEFLALMNCKIEMLDKAKTLTSAPYLFFIDAGLNKVVSPQALERLKSLTFSHKGVLAPGISLSRWTTLEEPTWRFCGGVVVASADFNPRPFYMMLEVLKEENRATWEGNVWALVEQACPGAIHWRQGHFSDDIIHCLF